MIDDEGVEIDARWLVDGYVRRQCRQCLGQIDGRPAAHRYHHNAVAILVLEAGKGGGQLVDRWLAGAPGNDSGLDPGGGEAGVDPLLRPRPCETRGPAHDPCPPAPESDHLADLVDPAGTKPDQRRRKKIVGGDGVVHRP